MAPNPYSPLAPLAHRVLAIGACVAPVYQCLPVKPAANHGRVTTTVSERAEQRPLGSYGKLTHFDRLRAFHHVAAKNK
jgi:hypothetical protein